MSEYARSAGTPALPVPKPFAAEEFAGRRTRIFEKIGAEAHALVAAAPPIRGFEVFRQSNQFHYCCGVEIPQAYVLMSGETRQTVLYLQGAESPAEERVAELKKQAGVDDVRHVGALRADLADVKVLFTPHAAGEGRRGTRGAVTGANAQIAADPWDGQAGREQRLIAKLRTLKGGLDIRNLTPVLDSLRAVKTPAEIEVCRVAGRLSAISVIEAMRVTKPGVYEYELSALAAYLYRVHGAREEGYQAIIAGGITNMWDAHYFLCDCPLVDGDLVLMDVAPDVNYYTSDIGRIWPVNGTYSAWQRELYGFMAAYHQALLDRVRPGVTADEVMDGAAEQMTPIVEATQWSKPIFGAAARRVLEFRGHMSHPVGMAVHDSGRYCDEPLKPGVVLSVDPQFWAPEERVYVRCEDTVVVTEDGMENLTAAAPLDLDEIEALMRDHPAELPLLG